MTTKIKLNPRHYLLGIALLLFPSLVFSQDTPEVKVGGALRFNYNLSSWKEAQKDRGGDLGYDVFRLNVKAKYKGIKLNTEYRLYSSDFGGGMLKQGWFGYDFNAQSNLQVGLTQVPFGITTYNSFSWFFSINYYVGLEDDHDMGIKYSYTGDKWNYAIAFFKNAEELRFGNTSDVSPNRYAYDVSSSGDNTFRNKEVNQFSAQLIRKFVGDDSGHHIGLSALYGGLYNLDTENMGSRYALAAHYEWKAKRFHLKAQVAHYNFNPKNPDSQSNKLVAMAAYGAPYFVASKATNYTLGLAYSIPVEWKVITGLQFYNDFGVMDKREKEFTDTYMNTFGLLVTAGSVYTYIDWAQGKNQPWLGNEWSQGLGSGHVDAPWESRFNINIGFYF